VRQDTDPLPKLDVRWLNRVGALHPGAVTQPCWQRGDRQICMITTYVDPWASHVLSLAYLMGSPGGELQPVREIVPLVFTPCTFGGQRTWFLCPCCRSRRAVLYLLGDRCRCRVCHNLAYSSSRERTRARATQRRVKLDDHIERDDTEPS
jgi:hypothetical protein